MARKRLTTLTHVDPRGGVRMVDVSPKRVTPRRAVASAVVTLGREAFDQLRRAALKKGDALATAQIAGVLAAKRTCDLIPLCHSLAPEFVDVRFELLPPDAVRVVAEARVEGKTGVELEALTAAAVAALTLYDMCKAVSKGIVIGPIQLEEKSGGRSGTWRRVAAESEREAPASAGGGRAPVRRAGQRRRGGS